MSKGTGKVEGEGARKEGSPNLISKLAIVKRSFVHGRTSSLVPRNQQEEQGRQENLNNSRRAGSTTTIVSHTSTEKGVRSEGGRFSTFMGNVPTTSIAGIPAGGRVRTGGQIFGVARQSPLADVVMR